MNVVKINGGLGNQLFAYAFGRAIMQNGIEVAFDISAYKTGWSPVPPSFLKRLTRKKIAPTIRDYLLDKFELYPCNFDVLIGNNLTIGLNSFDSTWLKTDNKNFSGHWHYWDYSKEIMHLLKKEIQIKEQYHTEEYLITKKEIQDTNSISIHVRRDDYKYGMGIILIEYYKNALKLIDGNVFVFSDDIKWCRGNFSDTFNFVHFNPYLDFDLMRLCKKNIIANSTFSYWAAMLNDNPDKIVIAPSPWVDQFINKGFPENWIKIKE